MKYVPHDEIDKAKWDHLVASSDLAKVYSLSWYLDVVAEKWDAIIWGDYEAAIPLPIKQFLFFKRVYQPYFCQQTGIICRDRQKVNDMLQEFLTSGEFRSFYSFRSQFSSQISWDHVDFTNTSWKLELRKNFRLDLAKSYEETFQKYNQNRKRNLKKAAALGWECREAGDIEDAIRMYKENQAVKQQGLSEEVYVKVRNLYKSSLKRDMGSLFSCLDTNGQVLAYAFFVYHRHEIYYLFGTMNALGKEHSAISVLFNDQIKKHAGKHYVLDFEGGSVSGIGSYFASFGAAEEQYQCLLKSWL